MDLKIGDRVHAISGPMHDTAGNEVPGIVKRVAKDGSWADVDWHWWSKRMLSTKLVKAD